MGWSIGFDSTWNRDIGYGVPAYCDHPDCSEKIDRGLAYVCGGQPYGGEHGCGLFFCPKHLGWKDAPNDDDSCQACERCEKGAESFDAKADHPEWMAHKLAHPSWQVWRQNHPKQVKRMRDLLSGRAPAGGPTP